VVFLPLFKPTFGILGGGMKKVQEQEQNLPMRYKENKKKRL
jgi:hypothetical protein